MTETTKLWVGHRGATRESAYLVACVVRGMTTPGSEGQGDRVVPESEDGLCGESILQELLPSLRTQPA